MKCPVCGSKDITVIDSRKDNNSIKRRRECQECLTRFNTTEKILLSSLPKYLIEKVIR